MRWRMQMAIMVLLLVVVSSGVQGAEYTTKTGETIHLLMRLLGHTSYALKVMNPWLPTDTEKQLPSDSTITFISQDDINCARRYVQQMVEPLSGKDRQPWQKMLDDLTELGLAGVHFLPGTPGITYRQVLAYARLWRQAHQPLQDVTDPVTTGSFLG